MEDSMNVAFPQFAPLSSPMVLALLREAPESFLAKMQKDSERLKLLTKLSRLEEQFLSIRDTVFEQISHAIRERLFSIKWFQETLQATINQKNSQKKYSVSLETISNWRESNVIRPQARGKIDPDCAAAILVAAILDERKQGFLPTRIAPDEPYWWCYAQSPPENEQPSRIFPCPYPFYPLEPGTLLWTRWPTFDDSWKQFGPYGAMRFSSLDKRALVKWDPSIDPNISLIFDERSYFGKLHQEALMHFSETALYRLAAERLNPSNPLPDIPPLWPSHVPHHIS